MKRATRTTLKRLAPLLKRLSSLAALTQPMSPPVPAHRSPAVARSRARVRRTDTRIDDARVRAGVAPAAEGRLYASAPARGCDNISSHVSSR